MPEPTPPPFTDPAGHALEIYFETRRYCPGEQDAPSLKNQAQRTPNRAIAPRRLEEVNSTFHAKSVNVKWPAFLILSQIALLVARV